MKNVRINNIRALAILLVVLGHSIILYSTDWGAYDTANKVMSLDYIKKVINIIQMPIFFSLSGYLFSYSRLKKQSFLLFLKGKIKRLLVPFLIFSMFWMVPIRLLVKYSGYYKKSIFIIAKNIIIGSDSGHLWYLSSLFLIFMFMYFIYNIFLKKNSFKYDFVAGVFVCVFCLIGYIFPIWPCVKNALIFSLFFYIGFLINRYENKLLNINKIFLLLSFIGFLLLTLLYKNKLFEVIASFSFLLFLYTSMPNKYNKLMDWLSKNSFGIYLFHSPLIYITFTYIPNANPFLVVFVNFILFGLIASLLTSLVRSLKISFVIGE